MSEITLFENPQFGSVRGVMRNGNPWFVAKDVCDCLGLTNPTMALEGLADDERAALSITEVSSNGVTQARSVNIISEPGVYRLIFKSRKAEAEAFRRWVTHDVIPSIRKTGMYLQTPTSYLAALEQCVALEKARLAAEEEKQKTQLALTQEQAAHEITALELKKALEQLGIAGEYSGVKTQSWLYQYFKSSSTSFKVIGQFLSDCARKFAAQKNTPTLPELMREVRVNRWNGKVTKVNVYHNSIWAQFKALVEVGRLNKYTKYIGKYFL